MLSPGCVSQHLRVQTVDAMTTIETHICNALRGSQIVGVGGPARLVLRVRHQDCLFSILDSSLQRRHRTDAESQQENFLHHSQCFDRTDTSNHSERDSTYSHSARLRGPLRATP